MTAWSHTRRAFGNGRPVSGAEYDISGSLRELAASLASAGPDSQWFGPAATNYDEANAKQRRMIGQLAVLDQRLASQIDLSAQVVESGRGDLEAVRQRIIHAAAALLEKQAGERLALANRAGRPCAAPGDCPAIPRPTKILQHRNGRRTSRNLANSSTQLWRPSTRDVLPSSAEPAVPCGLSPPHSKELQMARRRHGIIIWWPLPSQLSRRRNLSASSQRPTKSAHRRRSSTT
ncbi:EspA/EspE family type VII secretion system effector [Mycolicibacterium tusciae]|uniref:EspA/EspE family type VII secretion system effector n=1 Tax=Mycolicibacterium tusciae TaxID=75922 RepID=UPI003C6E6E14